MRIKCYIPESFYHEIKFVLFHWLEFWSNYSVHYYQTSDRDVTIQFDSLNIVFRQKFFSMKKNADNLANLLSETKEYNYFGQTFISPFRFEGKDFIDEGNKIIFNLDLIGTTFFWLSDYQSIYNNDYDKYYRIYAKHSLIKDFLKRPVVNEIFSFLIKFLQWKTQFVNRRIIKFNIIPTHDVDHPFMHYQLPYLHLFKNVMGDLILRKQNPWKRVLEREKIKFSHEDKFNTFDWILEQERDLESIFYFFAGALRWNNPDYNLASEKMLQLLQKVKNHQKTIGIHFGLGTSVNQILMMQELVGFQNIVGEVYHSRFHYLSFKNPETVNYLDDSIIFEDSTLAFPDIAGFRTGCCYPHYIFDFKLNKMSNLIENPLIFMEGTILDKNYEGKSFPDAFNEMINLKENVKKYNGNFVFLWHNHRLVLEEEKELFLGVIK